MAEENNDKATLLDLPNNCKYTEHLLDRIINHESKHLFFNGLSHSEKAVFIKSAIENKCKLKSLQVILREVLKYRDSKFMEEVRTYVTFKSRIYYYISILAIEEALLNLAKSEALEEKRKLEGQLDAKFKTTTASVEVDDERSEQKNVVEEDQKENIKTKSTNNNKIEIYPLQNIKGQTKLQEYNGSKSFSDESQSIKQTSCYSELDENRIKHKKSILPKDELENTVTGETFQIKKEKISPRIKNPSKNLSKSVKLKSDRQAKKHKNKNIFLENIEGPKKSVPVERLKPSNKTTKPNYKEEKSRESEVSRLSIRSLLKSLNIDIDNYEMQLRSIEKSLQFMIKLHDSVLFEDPKIYEIFDEVPVEEFLYEIEIHIKITRNSINALQYVKGAKNIMEKAIHYFFIDLETADVSTNMFNDYIQKIENRSFTMNKTRDTSLLENSAFQLNSINEEKNDESNKIVILMNKGDVLFDIDSDSNKVFELDGQTLISESKSTKVVLKYEDQNIEISFIDNQIVVSTENSELDISFCKHQPVDMLNEGTQTGP